MIGLETLSSALATGPPLVCQLAESSLVFYDVPECGGMQMTNRAVTTCRLPHFSQTTQQTKVTSKLDTTRKLLITTLALRKKFLLYPESQYQNTQLHTPQTKAQSEVLVAEQDKNTSQRPPPQDDGPVRQWCPVHKTSAHTFKETMARKLDQDK